MIQVSKKDFEDFLKTKTVRWVQGDYFHSHYYVDELSGEKVAYVETSSWGADEVYMIKGDMNLQTLLFVGGIIKNKQ